MCCGEPGAESPSPEMFSIAFVVRVFGFLVQFTASQHHWQDFSLSVRVYACLEDTPASARYAHASGLGGVDPQ